MQTCFYLLFFFHIAEGCTITDYELVSRTASPGGSVGLPCSCADPKDKTSSLTWSYRTKEVVIFSDIYPTDETNRYRGRVQLVDGAAPGNFTIVISHLTVVDGGVYRCRNEKQQSNIRLFNLTVEAPLVTSKSTVSTPEQNGGSKTTVSTPSPGTPLVPSEPSVSTPSPGTSIVYPIHLYVLGPVLLVLLLLLGCVLCWIFRAQKGNTRNKELQTGQKNKQGQDGAELLYLDVTFKPTRKLPQVHLNDEDVLYASVKVRSDNEQGDDVMYATVNKSRAQTRRQTAGD